MLAFCIGCFWLVWLLSFCLLCFCWLLGFVWYFVRLGCLLFVLWFYFFGWKFMVSVWCFRWLFLIPLCFRLFLYSLVCCLGLGCASLVCVGLIDLIFCLIVYVCVCIRAFRFVVLLLIWVEAGFCLFWVGWLLFVFCCCALLVFVCRRLFGLFTVAYGVVLFLCFTVWFKLWLPLVTLVWRYARLSWCFTWFVWLVKGLVLCSFAYLV